MIYLHKILPVLLSPYSLFFLCIIVGLVKRKYAIIWTALIVVLTLSTPVVSSFFFAKLEAVGSLVYESFMYHPPVDMAAEIRLHQQEQQQQEYRRV